MGWESNAYIIIDERIRATESFRAAKAMAIDLAVAEILEWAGVEDARAAGGRSAVIQRAKELALKATPGVDANYGSPMIPMTVRDVLIGLPILDEVIDAEWKVRSR